MICVKCIPKIIIIIPPTILKISIYSYRKLLNIVAEAPSKIKTVEKPNTKLSAYLKILVRTAVSSSRTLSKDVPAIKQRYPGTMGSTQGDKKLNNPANRT